MFAPKCAACSKSITPVEGTEETVRVVSMDRDFHVDCYVCEMCGLQLTDEPEQRCYPLDEALLCRRCHLQRLAQLGRAATGHIQVRGGGTEGQGRVMHRSEGEWGREGEVMVEPQMEWGGVFHGMTL